MEISPGIHKIDGVRGANCYLVAIETKMMLIDSGMQGNADRIISYIKGLGKNPSDVDYVILTHADPDHFGSAAEIRRMTGAKIAIHADDAPILTGKSRRTVRGVLGLVFRIMGRIMGSQVIEPDVILQDNTVIHGFRVVHTPGHTDGSICLYQPEKIIFVGDAMRADSKGNPRPPSSILSTDETQAKASLIAISKLEFELLCPGHGAPVVSHASAKTKKLTMSLK